MKTFQIICSQLFKAITFNKSYPDYRINSVKFSSWKVGQDGKVKYNHLQTLINYLKNQ